MPDPFVGMWILDAGMSESDPNHHAVAGTIVFELDPRGGYLMRAEGINAQG